MDFEELTAGQSLLLVPLPVHVHATRCSDSHVTALRSKLMAMLKAKCRAAQHAADRCKLHGWFILQHKHVCQACTFSIHSLRMHQDKQICRLQDKRGEVAICLPESCVLTFPAFFAPRFFVAAGGSSFASSLPSASSAMAASSPVRAARAMISVQRPWVPDAASRAVLLLQYCNMQPCAAAIAASLTGSQVRYVSATLTESIQARQLRAASRLQHRLSRSLAPLQHRLSLVRLCLAVLHFSWAESPP